jgi:hypothetical protein
LEQLPTKHNHIGKVSRAKGAQMVETLQIMRQKADTVAGVVKNISTIEDPNVALLYANSRLVAWRHNLFHKCFKLDQRPGRRVLRVCFEGD